MSENEFGFDAFARKWVPAPPAWAPAAERPGWIDAGSEAERRKAYLDAMGRAGGEGVAFGEGVRDRVRRDAAAGVPMLELLDGLLADPEVGDRDRAAILFQRVFGVPPSRAGFIASWRPSNRSREAERVLERVRLCVEDARRAGLWSPPPEA
jgi:hypothetical protein